MDGFKRKWVVAIDLGGTTTKLAFFNHSGKMIKKWKISTDKRNAGQYILDNIVTSIDKQLQQLKVDKEILTGIGMGAPGPVHLEQGLLYNAINLGWEKNYPLKKLLEKKMNLPVAVENDANCAALGEFWKGIGQHSKDLIFVTLGTGVGGGIISNGKLVRGVHGAGGEIGHITVIPKNGYRCNCGKIGCLETVASAKGIQRITKQLLASKKEKSMLSDKYFTVKDVFNAAKQCDPTASEVVDTFSFYLGLTLANIGNIFNPEIIILGGGIAKAGDFLVKKVQPYFENYAFPTVRDSTVISLTDLGNDAGVFGACRLILNQMMKSKKM